MRYHSIQSAGFSLVEVLVAISILLLVIVGPMTMITRSNNSTSFASEQVNAWFLAQEGLELAEKQRDDFLLQSFNGSLSPDTPWSSFSRPTGAWSDCFDLDNGCGLTIGSVAVPVVTPVDCTTVANCKLYIDNDSAVRPNYIHTVTASITPFTRVIKMEETANNREVKVTSTVSWRTGSLIASQKVEAVTYLFNVYGKP